MGLFTDLPKTGCQFMRQVEANLQPEDIEDLKLAMKERNISCNSIVEVLHGEGVVTSETTIRRHRENKCHSCSKTF